LLFRRHLYTSGFKLTKNIVIGTIILIGLLPVLIGALAPKDMDLGGRILLWLGGVATIFTLLFFTLRAKVWKKN
jgi:hypothetical protein